MNQAIAGSQAMLDQHEADIRNAVYSLGPDKAHDILIRAMTECNHVLDGAQDSDSTDAFIKAIRAKAMCVAIGRAMLSIADAKERPVDAAITRAGIAAENVESATAMLLRGISQDERDAIGDRIMSEANGAQARYFSDETQIDDAIICGCAMAGYTRSLALLTEALSDEHDRGDGRPGPR